MKETFTPSIDTTLDWFDWKKILWDLYAEYVNLNNQEPIKYSSPKFPKQSVVLYDDFKILYQESIYETYMFHLSEHKVTRLANGTYTSLKIHDNQLKDTILTIEHILQTSSIQSHMWYSVEQIVDDVFNLFNSFSSSTLSPEDFHPAWAKAPWRM
jgi:hypothetical protein